MVKSLIIELLIAQLDDLGLCCDGCHDEAVRKRERNVWSCIALDMDTITSISKSRLIVSGVDGGCFW